MTFAIPLLAGCGLVTASMTITRSIKKKQPKHSGFGKIIDIKLNKENEKQYIISSEIKGRTYTGKTPYYCHPNNFYKIGNNISILYNINDNDTANFLLDDPRYIEASPEMCSLLYWMNCIGMLLILTGIIMLFK